MMILNFMGGWQNMKGRVKWIIAGLLSLWIVSNDVLAAEIEEVRPSDMDLIEFIGGWESEDGEWLDPELFDAIFAEDLHVMEGESVLRERDLKSSETQERRDTSLEEEIPGVRKEGR